MHLLTQAARTAARTNTKTYVTIPGILQLGDERLRQRSHAIAAASLVQFPDVKRKKFNTSKQQSSPPPPPKPWMNSKMLHLLKKQKKLFNKAKESQKDKEVQERNWSTYRKFKKDTLLKTRQAEADYNAKSTVGTREQLQAAEILLHSKLEEFRTVMGYGRGIAGPQVNAHYRLIALNLGDHPTRYEQFNKSALGFLGGTSGEPFSLWNPSFVHKSKDTFTMWDDCMSFPHLMVRVPRHTTCSIRFLTVVPLETIATSHRIHIVAQDQSHGVVEIEWKDIPQEISELLQHEMDHLDGVLSMDRSKELEGSSEGENVIDRNEYLQNQKLLYDGMVDYTIVPTV